MQVLKQCLVLTLGLNEAKKERLGLNEAKKERLGLNEAIEWPHCGSRTVANKSNDLPWHTLDLPGFRRRREI